MVLFEVFNQSCVTFVSESGSHQKERPSKECSICYGDDIALHPLTCCPGDICTACFKKLQIQRCPFCNTPFTGMKGDQPRQTQARKPSQKGVTMERLCFFF